MFRQKSSTKGRCGMNKGESSRAGGRRDGTEESRRWRACTQDAVGLTRQRWMAGRMPRTGAQSSQARDAAGNKHDCRCRPQRTPDTVVYIM